MNIDRLYTLSQFVDNISNLDKNGKLGHNEEYDEIYIFDNIIAYNNFLKQPLSKDMFVNEDEKKVIFDNWEFIDSDYAVLIEKNKRCISLVFEDDNEISFQITDDRGTIEYTIKTIHDLAGYIKGELKLKNVEI